MNEASVASLNYYPEYVIHFSFDIQCVEYLSFLLTNELPEIHLSYDYGE